MIHGTPALALIISILEYQGTQNYGSRSDVFIHQAIIADEVKMPQTCQLGVGLIIRAATPRLLVLRRDINFSVRLTTIRCRPQACHQAVDGRKRQSGSILIHSMMGTTWKPPLRGPR